MVLFSIMSFQRKMGVDDEDGVQLDSLQTSLICPVGRKGFYSIDTLSEKGRRRRGGEKQR